MAQVSITQAAKLAGISRSNLYKSYIDKGLISVSKDEKDKPCIDISELIRVFPVLQGDSLKEDSTGHHSTPDDTKEKEDSAEVTALKSEIDQLKQQLSKSEEREGWYQAQIKNMTDTMKLLEAPKHPEPVYPRRWYQFWK